LGLLVSLSLFTNAQDVDNVPPVPRKAVEPPVPEKYRLNPSLAMFRAIEDEAPVRSERENADEYRAWTEVVQFANQFPAAEIEGVANRVLTSEDLIHDSRRSFFLQPIHFDGLIKSIERADASKGLQEFGVKHTYLARLIPAGEPFSHEILAVFSELPKGIDNADALKDRWVSFAGYSFKLMTEPPEGKTQGVPLSEWKRVPVLIGQSVTLLPKGMVPEGNTIETIPNKSLRIFQKIRDAAPMPGAEEESWPEKAAWNWVVLYARKFAQEDLDKNSRKGLGFADLFGDGRAQYKLDLVHFEGRLIRLRADKPPRQLRDAGLANYYEGWIIPSNQPPGQAHPVCVVLTELPEGLTPANRMNRQVSFSGYFFKRMHYESSERGPDEQMKWKGAPLLIGRSITVVPEDSGYSGGTWSDFFVPAVLLGFGGLLGTAGLLSWWLRHGDSKVKQAIEERRPNPFGN